MSDSSDSDGSINDLFGCQNRSLMISARGPNNVFSSTLQIPQPYARPRYAQSSFDQRSISRGDFSSRSVRSSSSRNHRNYSYYNRQGINGPGSMYNKRSQSPMSVRSKESCARPFVLDAAHVLKYDANYNDEEELDILEDACFTFLNNRRKYKKYASSNSSLRSMPTGSNTSSFKQIFNKPPPPTITQKERFKSGYLLPSQRFNTSVNPTSLLEPSDKELNRESNFQNGCLTMNKISERNIETDSDEDIFSHTKTQNPRKSTKRSIDSEGLFLPNTKRIKPLSPCKNSIEGKKLKVNNDKSNDFIFAKPICPARKSAKEKLISKSAASLDVISIIPAEHEDIRQDKPFEEPQVNEEQSNSTSNLTNLSMRPSFIKRKLFTQTLVTEKGNLSMENTATPEKNTIQKDKHKTRKLQQTSTQSCLSRDIQQEESNLIDLIQKIAPIDQTIATNQTNRTVSLSKNITEDDDNESDTYTDEEILNHTVRELEKENAAKESTIKAKEDKVIMPKIPVISKSIKVHIEKLSANHQKIKQFWDTDFETDDETLQSPSKTENTNSKEICRPDRQEFSNTFNYKKPTGASRFQTSAINFTVDNTQKINNSTLKLMCHRAPKRNKLDGVTNETIKSDKHKSENKQKKDLGSKSAKISILDSETIQTNTIANVENKKKSKNTMTEKEPIKLSEREKPKKDQQIHSSQKSVKKQTKTKDHTDLIETNAKKNQKTKNLNKTKQHLAENKTLAKTHPNTKETPLKSKVSRNKIPNNNETKNHARPNESSAPIKKQPKFDENNSLPTKHLNSKEILSKSKATIKQIHANKSPFKKKTEKCGSSLLEENNKTNRPMRLCRINSLNESADKSSLEQNNSINRSLRSRTNLNSILNKNNTILGQKGDHTLARLSDVSFSLGPKKASLPTKASTKMTRSCLTLNESDVSFSLIPSPRVTRSKSASRNNTMNSTSMEKKLSRNKVHIWDHTPSKATVEHYPRRIRTPNRRYMYQ